MVMHTKTEKDQYQLAIAIMVGALGDFAKTATETGNFAASLPAPAFYVEEE